MNQPKIEKGILLPPRASDRPFFPRLENRMNTPVCAVMLANGRPEMVKRAVDCYLNQTYPRIRLLIYDTGETPAVYPEYPPSVLYFNIPKSLTIGELRNEANEFAMIGVQPASIDIFVHWDSDDWSHPNRIEEQVALLQSSGAEAVGYRDMLFWAGSEPCPVCNAGLDDEGDDCFSCENRRWVTGTGNGAWLYQHPMPDYCLGTSLCYWRKTWEARPFEHTSKGEDWRWCQGVRCAAEGSLPLCLCHMLRGGSLGAGDHLPNCVPRMIASIHGGNTCSRIEPGSTEWTRVPAWDDRVRAIMEAR